jgi:D-sedoheptulose 7-phosphate isomerase
MQTDLRLVSEYIGQLQQVLDDLPLEPLAAIIERLKEARRCGQRVYVFGNGGSAATATHMACDFSKNTVRDDRPRFQAVSLTDNMSVITAYANDDGYENIFAEPVMSLGRAGDVALAISGSGNSPNVLKGVQAARALGMTTIGLTGMGGGKLKEQVDICLIVPSNRIEQVEDLHLIIDHLVTISITAAE